jgi:hypothetical protein
MAVEIDAWFLLIFAVPNAGQIQTVIIHEILGAYVRQTA